MASSLRQKIREMVSAGSKRASDVPAEKLGKAVKTEAKSYESMFSHPYKEVAGFSTSNVDIMSARPLDLSTSLQLLSRQPISLHVYKLKVRDLRVRTFIS